MDHIVHGFQAIAIALIETEAMKAANESRKQSGYSLAYGEESFIRVIDDMNRRIEAITGGSPILIKELNRN